MKTIALFIIFFITFLSAKCQIEFIPINDGIPEDNNFYISGFTSEDNGNIFASAWSYTNNIYIGYIFKFNEENNSWTEIETNFNETNYILGYIEYTPLGLLVYKNKYEDQINIKEIYLSEDNGETWNVFPSEGMPHDDNNFSITGLTHDDDGNIYASAISYYYTENTTEFIYTGYIFKFEEENNSWSEIPTNIISDNYAFNYIEYTPKGLIIYKIDYENSQSSNKEIYLSEDNGQTWNIFSDEGLPEEDNFYINEFTSDDTDTIYISGFSYIIDNNNSIYTGHIFKFNEENNSWSEVQTNTISDNYIFSNIEYTPLGLLIYRTNYIDNNNNKESSILLYENDNPDTYDLTLSNLTVESYELAPEFDPEITNYIVNVPYETASITIIAIANDESAIIDGDGLKELIIGENNFDVIVSIENTTETKTYTVIINRAEPEQGSDASLQNLIVSEGILTPQFDPFHYEYTIDVENNIVNISITGIPTDENANVTGNVENAELVIGENSFTITVVSENEINLQTYFVNVNRADDSQNNDATLRNLFVSTGILEPEFNPQTTNYIVEVDYEIENISLTGISNDENANVSGNVNNAPLTVGDNTFLITVTAQNLIDSKTYTVIVNRAESTLNNNADLRIIRISEGVLSPVFDPNILQYYVNIANNINDIELTAIPEDQNANVTGDGLKNLNIGNNPFNIKVIAEDGETTKIYIVNIRRAGTDVNRNADLSSLSTSYGEVIPEFNPNTLQYTKNVENDIYRISIFASTADPNALLIGTGEKTLEYGDNTFEIKVIAEDGETIKIYKIIIIRNLVSIDRNLTETASIYPNPAIDIINIDTKDLLGEVSVMIYNIHGQIFYENKYKGGSIHQIFIDNLPRGIYMIWLNDKGYKLIKI